MIEFIPLKVKILTYLGTPVNESKLHDGLYAANVPTLHLLDFTKESLENYYNIVYQNNIQLLNKIIDNIRQCEVETYILTKQKQQ